MVEKRPFTKAAPPRTSNRLWMIQTALILLLLMDRLRSSANKLNTTASCNNEANNGAAHNPSLTTKSPTTAVADTFSRLCIENPYLASLNVSLDQIQSDMDTWLNQELDFQSRFTTSADNMNHDTNRLRAFTELTGGCQETCVGGECSHDISKRICGLDHLTTQKECIIYSIGGNNQWEFENDLLERTSCQVHTFDCTGPRERFTDIPQHSRLTFHHICLGTSHQNSTGGRMGEIWTLAEMQQRLGHKRIDLLKLDAEGFEWPLLESWPELTDMRLITHLLPMQITMEVHYRTPMKLLTGNRNGKVDWKHASDVVHLQSHLLKMGYVTVINDLSVHCNHCTEVSLLRIKCPIHR